MANQNRTEIVSIRLTPGQHDKLLTLAKTRDQTLSELLRSAALGEVEKPIGWYCNHLDITGPAGVLGPPAADCGCEMKPIHEGERRPEWVRRALAQADKDDLFVPSSGVAITPWQRKSATTTEEGR